MKKVVFAISVLLSLNSMAETKCIAHRGYHQDAPDNSLAAFRAAQAVNADGIELDIVHTKDGVAIVNHDKTFKKTGMNLAGENCPKQTPISELSLEVIKSKCTLKNGEAVPTLEEALEVITTQDQMLFLELKDSPSVQTAQLVEKFYKDKIEKLRVISFSKKDIRKIKSVNKSAKSFWKDVKVLKLSIKPWGNPKNMGLNVQYKTYKSARKRLRRMNRELSVWTVNQHHQIELLLFDDVDYITTDNLETCLELKN